MLGSQHPDKSAVGRKRTDSASASITEKSNLQLLNEVEAMLFLKALQHIESHKGHMTILAGAAVQQSDRAGSQIAPVFIRFAISVPQRVL